MLHTIIRSHITWIVLCLCLIICTLFWTVFIKGKVIVPGDVPYYDTFFISEQYARHKTPLNLSTADQIEQFYVWRKLAASSMQKEKHIPLWNPYEFTGQPLVANAQSALFYPPNLLLFFISPAKVATISAIFSLLTTGIFTFLFCRELKISDLGSFFSSIAFTFSGPLITYLGHPHSNVLCFFPVMMWTGEKLLRQDNRLFFCAMLALAMGVSILGGHPETTFYCWFVFALYFFARIFFDKSICNKSVVISVFFSAAILGIFIGGIQLLPFTEALLHSSTYTEGRSVAEDAEKNLFSIKEFLHNAPQLITLICPNFYGNPVDWSYLWPFSRYQSYSDRAIYFGTIPFTLAIGAIFTTRKQQLWLIISLLAFICIGIAWHFPVLKTINLLPLFSKGMPLRLTFQFTFFAAIMSGVGLDILSHNLKNSFQSKSFLYLCLACLIATLTVSSIITAVKLTPLLATIPSQLVVYLTPVEFKTYIPTIIIIAFTLIYCIYFKLKKHSEFLIFSIFALTVIELVGFAWGYNPTIYEKDILPDTLPITLMRTIAGTQPFRILRTDDILHANFSAAYSIADISGYDAPISQRYEDIYRSQGGIKLKDKQNWKPEWSFIDFLNVKFILSKSVLDSNRFIPVYKAEHFNIYENKNVLPRAYMVFDSEVISDGKTILERLTNSDNNFGSKVILEESPQLQCAGTINKNSKYLINYIKYSNDEVTMEVSCDSPGILVMSDLYTPDWKAFINKVQTKIFRANYAYRSVVMPAGKHIITFKYAPLSFRIGSIMTIIGLLLFLTMISLKMNLPWNRRAK